MTLQEAKEQIAKKNGYENWSRIHPDYHEKYLDEAAELYAEDCRREGFNGGLMAERILNKDEIAGLKSKIAELERNQTPSIYKGKLIREVDGAIHFVPDKDGNIVVYELPKTY